MPNVKQSVGNGGVNQPADVKIVQSLLNRYVATLGLSKVVADGTIGPSTIAAIRRFQTAMFVIDSPNGRVDPNGKTITALNQNLPVTSLSGAMWWHVNQADYANSAQVSDLDPAFRNKAARFINAMTAANAQVAVDSTRRNSCRAYLMHFCWRLSRGEVLPSDVPSYPGCPINWDHDNITKSRTAATEMVHLFGLIFEPSRTSRHIDGKAIDMKISWSGTIFVKDAYGNRVALEALRDGSKNAALHAIGASYGVHKLISDPPHWSIDGR